eukprot:TRINITY_DN11153_c0_g1_i1.p1 TRINITY_DN11153_c0_g1~~TRINITY_DN11153_c0_g1_i1.p1  ORF type:complete len:472 (+),score=64.05 TRINITY_DN11153_c0_g1_i1:42-1418(+)
MAVPTLTLSREGSLTTKRQGTPTGSSTPTAGLLGDEGTPGRPSSPQTIAHAPAHASERTTRFAFVPSLNLTKAGFVESPTTATSFQGNIRGLHGAAHGSPGLKGPSPRGQDGGSGRTVTTTEGSDSQSASARSTSSLPTSARSQPNSARSATGTSARAPSSNENRPNSARRPEELMKQQGFLAIRKMHEMQQELEMWKAKAHRLQRQIDESSDGRVTKLELENKSLKEKLRKTVENVDTMRLKERVMTQKMGDVEERNKDLQNRLSREENLVKEMRKREKKLAKKSREEELRRENSELLQRLVAMEGSVCKSPRGRQPITVHAPTQGPRREEDIERRIQDMQRQLERCRDESAKKTKGTKQRRVSFGENEKPLQPSGVSTASEGRSTPRGTPRQVPRLAASDSKVEDEAADEDAVLLELNGIREGLARLVASKRRNVGKVTFGKEVTQAGAQGQPVEF